MTNQWPWHPLHRKSGWSAGGGVLAANTSLTSGFKSSLQALVEAAPEERQRKNNKLIPKSAPRVLCTVPSNHVQLEG